ncbi:hypothetical protein Hypma_001066 [Hypsizygus marmoreus]|uniref:Uncharacterized protein n=1 Tax=Hypsizygus marmoreus TaxID=39966 RepID=A0A369J6C4_HYPMA|nr:hypothetical protein Hypma_001066 [Hypsizygus marmoreus]
MWESKLCRTSLSTATSNVDIGVTMNTQGQGGKQVDGNSNPIPRNMVLWKDYQMIVIQAEPLISREETLKPFKYDPVLDQQRDNEWLFGLQYIHNLLHTIEFGKTNWAYLVPRHGGGYKIVQRPKRLKQIRCPTWAPLIEEKEITYTTWWPTEVRGGYWRGREVEIILGWDDIFLKCLELIMFAHLLLRGLDLTYKVLAHIVEKDGTVVGLVTEPELGRLVQYRDRGLVYDAISRLQRRGLVYPGIANSNLHILNGKVRLSNLVGSRHYYDPAEVEKLAALVHWECLEDFFADLDPNDFAPRPTWQRRWDQVPQLMPSQPSPEPPLELRIFGFPMSKDPSKLWWTPPSDSGDRCDARHDKKRRGRRRGQPNHPVVIALQLPEATLRAIQDAPRSTSPRASRRHHNFPSQAPMPYRKASSHCSFYPRITTQTDFQQAYREWKNAKNQQMGSMEDATTIFLCRYIPMALVMS